MKKIIALGASNSSKSINRAFAKHASSLIEADVELLDLNDFEMPIYSMDREEAGGIPTLADQFAQKIIDADGVIISFAEHNGSYSAAFKNILDWISRREQKAWADKKLLLLATSPGGRGGKSVLETAKNSFPHFGATVVASFSLPSFYKTFLADEGIVDPELKGSFNLAVSAFKNAVTG